MKSNQQLSIFWSPGFLIALAVLVINDHVLKYEFHNSITGKLSDIAGLFLFPIFFSVFAPKYKYHVYWITAVGFIYWKSPLSNEFIYLWNGFMPFKVHRIIDWSDLLTLSILPFSYWYLNKWKVHIFRLHPLPIMIITAFAFIATSRHQRIDVYREYKFKYNQAELIRRLNEIAREDGQIAISNNSKYINYKEPFEGDTIYYHVSGYREYKDTLYDQHGKIDTVRNYQIPLKDTVYIYNHWLYYDLNVQKYFKTKPNDYCSYVKAKMMILDGYNSSEIKIVGFYTMNCQGVFVNKNAAAEIERLEKIFSDKLLK